MEIKGGCDIDKIPAPPPTAEDEGLISSNPPWGWQEAMVALGGILCIIAAVALPWAKVTATWRSILWGSDIELGTYTFKLLENPWLAAALSFALPGLGHFYVGRRGLAVWMYLGFVAVVNAAIAVLIFSDFRPFNVAIPILLVAAAYAVVAVSAIQLA